jgi:hypothetical protein
VERADAADDASHAYDCKSGHCEQIRWEHPVWGRKQKVAPEKYAGGSLLIEK